MSTRVGHRLERVLVRGIPSAEDVREHLDRPRVMSWRPWMTTHSGSKVDGSSGRGGWRRWSKEEGAAAVARWRASGLTAKEFAVREGVSAQRLHRWSKAGAALGSPPTASSELRSHGSSSPTMSPAPVPFMRVTPTGGVAGTLRVEHEGVIIVVREDIAAATLASVVQAVRAGSRAC